MVTLGLVHHLERVEGFVLESAAFPDQENRTGPDIDFLANGTIAIEHTSLDVLPEQRSGDHVFSVIAGSLMDLGLPLDVVLHWPSVAPRKPAKIGQSLRTWLLDNVSSLWGTQRHDSIPNVPFPVTTRTWEAGRELNGPLTMRMVAIPAPVHIAKHLNRKACKLQRYMEMNCKTILLVESTDPAIFSMDTLDDALRLFGKSFPESQLAVDEVWFADARARVESEIEYVRVQQNGQLVARE
jgi:hypothetical protein